MVPLPPVIRVMGGWWGRGWGEEAICCGRGKFFPTEDRGGLPDRIVSLERQDRWEGGWGAAPGKGKGFSDGWRHMRRQEFRETGGKAERH